MTQGYEHVPVMADEVVEMFAPSRRASWWTPRSGAAGTPLACSMHRRIATSSGSTGTAPPSRPRRRTSPRFGDRVRLRRARFDRVGEIAAAEAGGRPIAGVLFDLGVSSPQVDDPARGFSYRFDGPLDMRMDDGDDERAADLVNGLDAGALAELFAANGEPRFARRLAAAIVEARPITTTGQLVDVVDRALPGAARRRGHPAKRVFQALRIAVNDEIDVLGPAIDAAIGLLVPGGRCVVLSYHSGEDRLVKDRFATAGSGGCQCPPGLPCVCGAVPVVKVLTRGARMPGADEVARNPRAKSARLRAVERLGAAA